VNNAYSKASNLKLFGVTKTITRNNRGSGNRRNPTGLSRGLGTSVRVGRNVMRSSRNTMEPAMMASRLVTGDPDPTPTPSRSVFERALIGTLQEMTGTGAPTGNLGMSNILSFETTAATGAATGAKPRFTEGRLKRLEVWGTAADEAADFPLTVTLFTASAGDGAIFRDFGTPGQRRPHIAIIPNFDLRQTWFDSSNSTPLFNVVSSGTSTETTVIIRVTLELR